MKTVTPTELRANIYKLLEEVLDTGIPLEINKGNKRLRIVPVEQGQKLQNLTPRADVIQGDPEDLVTISWEKEVNLDLP
ncbi:MAG: type II toxin-antitoxin system Phd/YefM family antitoxin [Candidatus Promineifilaceae bacterium]|jgi:prevent-host-death family protein|nr:type II toxin-antitoxin system Phd/YefM family antitoxin [Anaerolineaceae bacterium]